MVLLSKSKQRKIVLIQPPSSCVDIDSLEPNIGLLYIAAVLRQDSSFTTKEQLEDFFNKTALNVFSSSNFSVAIRKEKE